MNPVHTIRFPTHHPAKRQSEPVPIGVAVVEAYAAITARSGRAARRLRTRTG